MNGYLVVVSGDYFGTPRSGDRKKEKFPYRIEVKVPSPEGALSLIKNKLLDRVLRNNYDNYYAYRTHQLVSITNLDGSKVYGLTDPRLMDFNDLAEYVTKNKLPLKLSLYTDLGYFRTMVHLASTNQKEFLIKQADLERDSAEDRLLAELNPDLDKPMTATEAAHNLKMPNNIDRAVSSDTEAVRLYKLAKAALEKTGLTVGDVVDKETVRNQQIAEGLISAEPIGRETVITNEEKAVVDPENSQSKDGQMFQTVDAPASNMITEDKPDTQKVDKVYIPGKGFIDVDKFKEDFDKEDEKEFEVYDPAGIGEAGLNDVQAEPDDIPEAGGAVNEPGLINDL